MSSTSSPRSAFVTVLAWFSIIIAALMTLLLLLQNAVLFLIPLDAVREASADVEAQLLLPFSISDTIDSVRVIVAVLFVLSLITLIASVELLRRKNWARIVFIFLLATSIVWCLFSLVLQERFNLPKELMSDPGFMSMLRMIKIMNWAFAALVTVSHAWIIKKLYEPAIRQEFHSLS